MVFLGLGVLALTLLTFTGDKRRAARYTVDPVSIISCSDGCNGGAGGEWAAGGGQGGTRNTDFYKRVSVE